MNDYIGRAIGRKFALRGINVFEFKWKTTGMVHTVYDPETDKAYSLNSYYISPVGGDINFIAGKDDKGSWMFFRYE